jgi:hypothetical protein
MDLIFPERLRKQGREMVVELSMPLRLAIRLEKSIGVKVKDEF